MKKIKRIISIVLTLTMLVQSNALQAFAVGEESVEEKVGDYSVYEPAETCEEELLEDNGQAPYMPLNLDNIEYTFTSTSGSTLSSKANGKGKILIFFKTTCYNSQSTISDINNHLQEFSDIDIYGIESDGSSMSFVSSFIELYNENGIPISCDTGSGNNSARLAYEKLAEVKGTKGVYPVICYIDEKDKLQQIVGGLQGASVIRSYADTYCDNSIAGRDYYEISYELNDGVNNEQNPTFYSTDSCPYTLRPAVRCGYSFDGWYVDSSMTEKITQISSNMSGNLTLRAKWTKLDGEAYPSAIVTNDDDSVVVHVEGKYVTETAETILNRINAIRKEACEEGVLYNGVALTPSDYKPLKWSTDVEAVTRLRAAETSIMFEHSRPNLSSCFDIQLDNGFGSYGARAECIAYNARGLMYGIEQFYGEKADYVNNVPGAVVGHYLSQIDPDYTAVAVSCFERDGYYYVAQQFMGGSKIDERKNPNLPENGQDVEVHEAYSLKVDIDIEDDAKTLTLKKNQGINLKAKLQACSSYNGFYEIQDGGKWESSDTSVATVNAEGYMMAVSEGKTTIKYTFGKESASLEVVVEDSSLTEPEKRIYFVGEKIDLTGAKIETSSGNVNVTESMLSQDFKLDQAGVKTVAINYGSKEYSFEVLVIEKPEGLEGKSGASLSSVVFPKNDYGAFEWSDGNTILGQAGVSKYKASFVAKNNSSFGRTAEFELEVEIIDATNQPEQKDEEIPYAIVEASEGNVVVNVPGKYYTLSAEAILKRLNEIRYEACKEGISYGGKKLTLEDYVPLKWSAGLEAVARLRAAEAKVYRAHTRPNGDSCFSVTTNEASDQRYMSAGENLAWNWDGLMYGIEQFYDEKYDLLNNTGRQTGHYLNMINPNFRYVGMGCFNFTDEAGWYCVAQRFGGEVYGSGAINEKKDSSTSTAGQNVEFLGKYVTGVNIVKSKINIKRGDEYTADAKVALTSDESVSGKYIEGGKWTSSDTKVAKVSKKGLITAVGTGTAKITLTIGTHSDSIDIEVYGDDVIQCTAPSKTTYILGEKINLADGKVAIIGQSEAKLTGAMISGFDSKTPGICKVNVIYKNYATSFDVLIISPPKASAEVGAKLSEIVLKKNDYGSYKWKDGTIKFEKVGQLECLASFQPKNTKFSARDDIKIQVKVTADLTKKAKANIETDNLSYDGNEIKPKTIVAIGETILKEGTDYTVSYKDNLHAGTGTLEIAGAGDYFGTITREFTILPAKIVIRADDLTLTPGEKARYTYKVNGLFGEDGLITEPVLVADGASDGKYGIYEIVPSGAQATADYEIEYENGQLILAPEKVSYKVTFEMNGVGEQVDVALVPAGNNISSLPQPEKTGYVFEGWYKDNTFKKKWDNENDIVTDNLTLYAKWLKSSKNKYLIQAIPMQSYTGSAIKPTVAIYHEGTQLKINKDYKLTYENNTNAGTATITVTGKGAYTINEKVKFDIVKMDISSVTIKYNEQLVTNSKKAQKVFLSAKYKKAMKKDIDFSLALMPKCAFDKYGTPLNSASKYEDAMVPEGAFGRFTLIITGKGNFEGAVERDIFVANKDELIKNASIILDKSIKTVAFTGKEIKPTNFKVKLSGKYLDSSDYTISYSNNIAVGKAMITITGKGKYRGSKSTTFTIKGDKLTKGKLVLNGFKETAFYTGKPITQNKIKLSYNSTKDTTKQLVYGRDYTISYSKNVKKGTATMTIIGCPDGGYTGTVKYTFKILP